MTTLYAGLPIGKRFGTLVIDPPWTFKDKGSRVAPDFKDKHRYKTLSYKQLKKLPVAELAADNAHLYLWTTDAHLPQAIRLMAHWGFRYTLVRVWRKMTKKGKAHFGMGHYYRHDKEMVLFGVRGKAPAKARNVRTSFKGTVGAHSQKPEKLQDDAEKVSPGPYLELFARRLRPGWVCWGNQLLTASDEKEVARTRMRGRHVMAWEGAGEIIRLNTATLAKVARSKDFKKRFMELVEAELASARKAA